MNLLELKKYLMQVKMASLSSLSSYFNCDKDLLRQMLTHWMQKGCVRKCENACGKKCMKCEMPMTEIYEWVVYT